MAASPPCNIGDEKRLKVLVDKIPLSADSSNKVASSGLLAQQRDKSHFFVRLREVYGRLLALKRQLSTSHEFFLKLLSGEAHDSFV